MLRSLLLTALFVGLGHLVAFGSTLSGRAVGPSDAPIAGASVRVTDSFTGAEASPADLRTGADGRFAALVSDGVFDVFVLPDPATRFPAASRFDRVVAGDTDLGDVRIDPGLVVAGRFLDPDGAGVADAHVDVYDAASGAPVAIVGGLSDATGAYSLLLRAGAYRFVVEPPLESGLAHHDETDIAVSSDRPLDVVLERTPVAARIEPVGRLVALGGYGTFDAFVRNDSLARQTVAVRIVFEDPSRHAVSALTSPEARTLGPVPRTHTVRFSFNVPPNTPDLYRHHPLHFRLLLRDAASGVVIDADRSAFEID
jgi:hypothetical protein